MTNNSFDKGFHVVKLSITALVLDFVSLELVVVQERFQQLTGVHSILEKKVRGKMKFAIV